MRKVVQERVMKIANIIETIIGVLLIISISISVIYLIFDLTSIIRFRNTIESFSNYLSASFSLIIGIEFIKMLSKHTPETVIEVFCNFTPNHIKFDKPLEKHRVLISNYQEKPEEYLRPYEAIAYKLV